MASFYPCSDVARAIVKATEAPLKLVDKQIFNVGDDNLNNTIGNLAEMVAKIVKKDKKGKRVKITVNDDINNRRNYRVSFGKIRKKLGFGAKVSLEDGVYEMYNNLKKRVYKKHYRDPLYVNLEMTKLLQIEFRSGNSRT